MKKVFKLSILLVFSIALIAFAGCNPSIVGKYKYDSHEITGADDATKTIIEQGIDAVYKSSAFSWEFKENGQSTVKNAGGTEKTYDYNLSGENVTLKENGNVESSMGTIKFKGGKIVLEDTSEGVTVKINFKKV